MFSVLQCVPRAFFEGIVLRRVLNFDLHALAAQGVLRIENFFPVSVFTTNVKVVLSFEFVDEIQSMTIQMKATEQYFPVVLFIMLYKMVLAFESGDEILTCDHSNQCY